MQDQKTAEISWKGEGLNFNGRVGSNYAFDVSSSASAENGGSPMEFFLAGVAGCTAIDVLSILQKMRQEVTDFSVNIRGLRATEHPKVYTEATLEYVVTGRNIEAKAVERAIKLSKEAYCSASIMFARAGAALSTSYRILEAAE